MKRQDDLRTRKLGDDSKITNAFNDSNQSEGKRVVPNDVQKFLELDAKLTEQFTRFVQSKLPSVSKSETKFMEISGSGFVWLPGCVLLYLLNPLVPKQLSVNLILAFVLDIVIVGLLKAFARRRRPPTKNPDYFKSIGPDQYSFPSGHASRAILISYILTQIYPLFENGFLYLAVSLALWGWSFTVCLSRLLNGRHYLFDVLVGVVVGFIEGLIVSFFWLSAEQSDKVLSFFSEEAPEI